MTQDLDTAAELMGEIAAEIEEQSSYLVIDAESMLQEIGCVLNRNFTAMQLWRRWFREYRDPWFKAEDGELWCAFCDGKNKIHKRGCIYMAAERLVKG